MIKAILFDLDDTLYDECDFYRDGFACLGELLQSRGFGTASDTADQLFGFHVNEGRDKVLQKLTVKLGFPAEWIPELAKTFRTHSPRICLAKDTVAILPLLRKKFKLGCVTDGWKTVQRAKIAALGVEAYLDAIVVTDDWGLEYWKPHPFPFKTCCEMLKVAPSEAIYVGDNPDRDMIGAQNANIKSIRIRRPGAYFRNVELADTSFQPSGEIQSLVELEKLIHNLEARAIR